MSTVYCPIHRGFECYAKVQGCANVPPSAYPKATVAKPIAFITPGQKLFSREMDVLLKEYHDWYSLVMVHDTKQAIWASLSEKKKIRLEQQAEEMEKEEEFTHFYTNVYRGKDGITEARVLFEKRK